ncbi:MAG: helix-turn-helix domain-containing protein, partial [Acidobacteriota bacterium]
PITEVWPEARHPGERVTERSILADIEAAKVKVIPPLDLADVLKAVKQVYGVYYAELASPSRERRLSEARAVATQIVSELPHLTLVDLSALLNRDVSSLSHCVRRMKEWLEYDPQIRERLEAVRRLLP